MVDMRTLQVDTCGSFLIGNMVRVDEVENRVVTMKVYYIYSSNAGYGDAFPCGNNIKRSNID